MKVVVPGQGSGPHQGHFPGWDTKSRLSVQTLAGFPSQRFLPSLTGKLCEAAVREDPVRRATRRK